MLATSTYVCHIVVNTLYVILNKLSCNLTCKLAETAKKFKFMFCWIFKRLNHHEFMVRRHQCYFAFEKEISLDQIYIDLHIDLFFKQTPDSDASNQW